MRTLFEEQLELGVNGEAVTDRDRDREYGIRGEKETGMGIDLRDVSDSELTRMREEMDREMADRGKDTRSDDGPRSYGERNGNGGRRHRTTEIQGVMFQVKVPVGRRGETMPGYLLFPPVRDERELQDLAEQVEREFRLATLYQPKDRDHGRGGYRGRDHGYDRDRGRDRY